MGGSCALVCAGGTNACGASCVDFASDPENCGGCGLACPAGHVCSAGACALSCQAGLSDCGGSCVNLLADDEHCGACEAACAPGEDCAVGGCVLACAGGTTPCEDACVDASLDPANCGACGNACLAGELCVSGQCTLQCGAGTTDCGGVCVSTSIDPQNCGACGAICPAGEVCSAGGCALSCAGGTTKCGDQCVDTANDPAHCGGCDAACPAGQICTAGGCALCGGGTTSCAGVCIDTSVSPTNCGSCGHQCPYVQGGQPGCSGGACGILGCTIGHANCDGDSGNGCETYLYNDHEHCGSCANACTANQQCQSGVCVGCAAGQVACDNSCTSTFTDTWNCGSCDNYCPSAPHASRTCTSGVCGFTCTSGYGDCDADAANGCETPVTTSTNCGSCGNACSLDKVCAAAACTNCSAVPLGSTVPQTVSGTTLGSPNLFSTVCSAYGPDVAYSFTAPATANYVFDTIGSTLNTVLSVRDGGCGGPEIACNGDYVGLQSQVALPLVANQTVIVVVDSYSSAGAFVLHVY